MAFHFQPRADSSDEEEVDLAAWQSGSKPKSQAAPMATMISAVEDPDEDVTGFAAFQSDGLATFGSQAEGDVGEEDEEEEIEILDVPDSPEEQAAAIAEDDVRPPSLQHESSTNEQQDQQSDREVFVTRSFTSINKRTPLPFRAIGRDSEEEEKKARRSVRSERKQGIYIPVLPRINLSDLDDDVEDYTVGGNVVRLVKEEISGRDKGIVYKVEFQDRHVEEIAFQELLQYKHGKQALDNFERDGPPSPTPEPSQIRSRMSSTRPGRKRGRPNGFGYVNTVDAVPISDDEDGEETRTRGRKRKHAHTEYAAEPESDEDDESASDEDEPGRRGRPRRGGSSTRRSLRSSTHPVYTNELAADEEDDSDDAPFLDSDLPGAKRRRTKLRLRGPKPLDFIEDGIGYESNKRARVGERQSGRSTRHVGGMQEIDENNIYRSDSDDETRAPVKPRVVGVREQFKTLPRNDEFRMRHIQQCDSCGQDANFAQMIYCQGCTLAYHKSCLGTRSTREHLVTKVDEEFSVLQCRRCVAFAKKREPTAPDQGQCADCHEHGLACQPFRPRKTTAQEQKEREDNDGEDPIYPVDGSRINQASNVLFRCMTCWRAFHFEHLPSRTSIMDMDIEVDAEQRFREYSGDWKCKECFDMPAKVNGLIAWKPVDEDKWEHGLAPDAVDEDDKAYLVKWEGMSYFRAQWMPGAWVWGVTAHSMRKAFMKRDDSQHPKMRTEDAIPEDYLRTDIVLDIKFTSIVDIRTEEIDIARIKEIDRALIKYKGLPYEEAVWEAPPSSEDEERWQDFVMAYKDWVAGRYVHPLKSSVLKARLDKARTQDFRKLEKKKQPDNVEGGELMHYQIEGLNWLYYKWFTRKNAILADEMGLGKTIQIIGFLATLVAEWGCFPFLVVVPNSTCPNWRREIKRWAPSLRVVAFYGSKESRDRAYRYELFPEGSKDLRCHVVVTSYDAAQDDKCQKFFRSVQWQALIVDEGQRLKNDKNLLYSALGALKCPFRILLTGTPLQNNQRELFNLLHFLDESYDAAKLDEEFNDLDTNKITQLHDMIRPFFLRRTKAQVLTFLPPMAQIIVPVSMTLVQKKVYRTILAKNPELMRAIFSSEAASKQTERASLSNILMQLRKCLCHPFVYNSGIEDRKVSYSNSHRNLVDASAKLKLLEILLPKLKERGHRVLIFSQFLDMLSIVEDFLDGMQLGYGRLDGSITALHKQKRIDEFNAPNSSLFAFLLSTRAGGVGINLASADTVIILDPDFNPHQDIQALSRAHRIGQSKKVLVFQLVTRASAEERIMQMGRKKLALDHVLIREMDVDDADQADLVSVLRHGANEIFEDSGDQDITYDDMSVNHLLDRSQIEDTSSGADKSAETQFSFARVWANDQGALRDEMGGAAEQQAPDPGVWAKILRERERAAAQEAAAKADEYGRGRRARGNVDYNNDRGPEDVDGLDLTPVKGIKMKDGDESDTDFQADASDGDDDPFDGEDSLDRDEVVDLDEESGTKRVTGHKKAGKQAAPNSAKPKKSLPTPAAGSPKSSPNKTGKKPNVQPGGASAAVKKPLAATGKKAVQTAAPKPKIAKPKAKIIPAGAGSKVKTLYPISKALAPTTKSNDPDPKSKGTDPLGLMVAKLWKTGLQDPAAASTLPRQQPNPTNLEGKGKGTLAEPIVFSDDDE